VRFARIQDELLATLDEATGLDLARIGVRSPAAWILKLPAGIWLAAMPAHEARHLLQAQAVRADPRFPAPQ